MTLFRIFDQINLFERIDSMAGMDMKPFKTSISRVWIDELEIGRVEFLPKVRVTGDGVLDHFRACERFYPGRSIPVLVDIRNVGTVEREARVLFSGEVAMRLTRAAAVLVDSPVSRIIGKFFIGLNRPGYPIRMFSSEKKALEWLRGYVE